MNHLWILVILLTSTNGIASINATVVLDKYCREKDRLITSEENDEYLLVSVEVDALIILECRFCNENEEKQTKIWYYQDRNRENPEREVELGMDNNSSYNRVYTTPELSLVIKNFEVTDAGIYLCHGEEGQEVEKKFNYRIEPIIKEYGAVFIEKGNATEWEKYSQIYLASVTSRFAVSRMPELAEIREDGVTLEVVSEWAPWSSCEFCVRNRGYRSSRGYCRLKRYMNTTIANETDSAAVLFFRKAPLLPCRSILLQQEFPSISNAIRDIPEFLLKEPCKKCEITKKKKKTKKFKFAKRYVLAEGAYLSVPCPESSMETQVVWKKDSITLEMGVGRSFRKLDPEARVIVDTFSHLHLADVSNHEEGNYTCYVDKVNMMQLTVVVVSKDKLLTQEFLRHLGYLGFILLLSSFCYCSGLVIAFRRRHRFDVIDDKTETSKKEEDAPLIEQNE